VEYGKIMPGILLIIFWWLTLFPIVCVLATPVILTSALFSKKPFISTTKTYYQNIKDWFRSSPKAVFTHRADSLLQKIFYSFIFTLISMLPIVVIGYCIFGLVIKIDLHEPAVITISITTFFFMWMSSLGGIFIREMKRDKSERVKDQIDYKVAKGFGIFFITLVGIMMIIMLVVILSVIKVMVGGR
jgi:hypothetical protein